eukprot:2198860-Pyramimonas_sp.AAC.1
MASPRPFRHTAHMIVSARGDPPKATVAAPARRHPAHFSAHPSHVIVTLQGAPPKALVTAPA